MELQERRRERVEGEEGWRIRVVSEERSGEGIKLLFVGSGGGKEMLENLSDLSSSQIQLYPSAILPYCHTSPSLSLTSITPPSPFSLPSPICTLIIYPLFYSNTCLSYNPFPFEFPTYTRIFPFFVPKVIIFPSFERLISVTMS